MSNPIPNMPLLSSIEDRNTRVALQSIIDGLRVRNGEVGTGEHRFLTLADLTDGIASATSTTGAGGTVSSPRSTTPGVKSVGSIIQKLSDAIFQSRLWKHLEERIVWIDTPEWFQGKFGAAIKTETFERQSGESAMAKQLTTAVTNINGNLALAQDEIKATSDLAGATAAKTTTLQTEVAGSRAVAQEAFTLSQSIDGKLTSSWSVKVDANGYVAGFGFGVDGKAGSYSSDFYVRADRFAVGAPGAQKVVPFFVQGGVSYMDIAMIRDLSVDTIKVAGNAITVPLVNAYYGSTAGNGGWQNAVSIYISNPQTNISMMTVQGMFSARVGYYAGVKTTNYRVLEDGGVIVEYGSVTASYVDFPSFSFTGNVWPGTGKNYTVQFWGQDSSVIMGYRSLMLLGVKR